MALPASDTFTGTNNNPLSGSWTTLAGGWKIFHNAAEATAAGLNAAMWNADSFGADQYSQAAITSSGGAWGGGVAVRLAATRGYYCQINSTLTDIEIRRMDAAASSTLLTTISGLTIADGDVIRLEVSGSTLTLKQNGTTRGTTSDGTYASGSAGLFSQNANGAGIDNWQADNLAAATITADMWMPQERKLPGMKPYMVSSGTVAVES